MLQSSLKVFLKMPIEIMYSQSGSIFFSSVFIIIFSIRYRQDYSKKTTIIEAQKSCCFNGGLVLH